MFEQSIYDADPVAAPSSEGDLFHDYEIRNWDLGPRIYKILALAGVGNLLALLIVSQTSLLTMKGCDSPLVGRVCQALDTIYVGSMLLGTDREYVDAAYDKTELGDVDITFVDVSGDVAPLSYPEGYFQIANPDSFQASLEQPADPFLTNTFPPGVSITPPSRLGSSLLDHPPNIPKRNDDIIDGDLPDEIGSTTKPGKKLDKTKPTASPTPDGNTADKDPKVDPTDPVATVEVNKRPWVDLANSLNDDKNPLNLETPFLVSAVGKLDKTGKFDPKSFKYIKTESTDQKMIDVVKRAIEAVNDSNLLQYLSKLEGNQLALQVQQDDLNVMANVQTDFATEQRATSMATLFKLFLDSKKKEKEAPEADQNDKDDLALLQNASVSSVGKKLTILFTIPKADVQRMLQRKLAEQKNAPKTQNNNSISGKVADNTAKN